MMAEVALVVQQTSDWEQGEYLVKRGIFKKIGYSVQVQAILRGQDIPCDK